MHVGEQFSHAQLFNIPDKPTFLSKPIAPPIPEALINDAKESGLAGQWEGSVSGNLLEVIMPNALGDIWGSREQQEEGTIKISFIRVKKEASSNGLGSLLLKIFAATAKEELHLKKIVGSVASPGAVQIFLKVFGENAITFTDGSGKKVSSSEALQIKLSSGDQKVNVAVDLNQFDTANIPKANISNAK